MTVIHLTKNISKFTYHYVVLT